MEPLDQPDLRLALEVDDAKKEAMLRYSDRKTGKVVLQVKLNEAGVTGLAALLMAAQARLKSPPDASGLASGYVKLPPAINYEALWPARSATSGLPRLSFAIKQGFVLSFVLKEADALNVAKLLKEYQDNTNHNGNALQ